MSIRAASLLVCVCLLAGIVPGCATQPRTPPGAPAAGAAEGTGRTPKVVFSRAEGFFFSGRYREALADYTEVIAAEPANAVAVRCRAAAHAVLGLETLALADYERAVTIDPRYDEAWLGRGLYLFSRGRYAEALDDFDRASAIDPGNAVALRYKAIVCERVGRLRDARLARESYIHCESQSQDGVAVRARPEPREIKALKLSAQ